jgi:ribonuclease P protein component
MQNCYNKIMLQKKYRASRIDIAEAIKTGSSIFGTVLSAKISRNTVEKGGFAIVVAKKIEKTSVGRHRIKRKISTSIESRLSQISPDFRKTIVFFAKDAKNPLFPQLAEKDVQTILEKIHFFK